MGFFCSVLVHPSKWDHAADESSHSKHYGLVHCMIEHDTMNFLVAHDLRYLSIVYDTDMTSIIALMHMPYDADIIGLGLLP